VGLAIFRTFTEHLPEIRAYRESGRLLSLYSSVLEDMPRLNREYHPQKMAGRPEHFLFFDEAYNSGGFIALLGTWLSEDPIRSPEEMAEVYAAIMSYT
ncbi:MAG: hypothetical protein PHD67_10720, partial [Oscillospiraceae bacterium]|nr:hypothetical protein [Oscillospiraceae bacterium]